MWSALSGETNSIYNASNPGDYIVTAVPNACASVTDTSYTKKIFSYLDRQPYIYADQNTICKGDTSILRLSVASSWYAKQWLQSDIVIGSGGYNKNFVGMINNSAADTQVVNTYNSYVVSAKHNSCPNGLKVRSNIVFIKPTLNPEIIVTSSLDIEPKHIIDWDSTMHYIGCSNGFAHMTLNNTNYDSIYWHELLYAGDDDYALGSVFATTDSSTTALDAKWITAVVVNSDGCVGQSTPILLDAWAFQTPAVTSYNNSELCDVGDSTLVHLSFPGTWIRYEWTRDGVVIPNSDNDSLWANAPGEYVINAYPELCPNIMYSSGIGPIIKYLYADILENDTLLYAMPELGYYTYQWFFNGDSINAPIANLPWIFPKDQLQNGIYTVTVSNENCTKLSTSYVWNSTGMGEVIKNNIKVYPNPVDDKLYIEFDDNSKGVKDLIVTDMNGRIVYQTNSLNSNYINTDHLAKGMYIVKIKTEDNHIHIVKLSKN